MYILPNCTCKYTSVFLSLFFHSSHELHRSSTSGSIHVSDLHNLHHSGSSDPPPYSSSSSSHLGNRTPRRPQLSDSNHSQQHNSSHKKTSGLVSTTGSWHSPHSTNINATDDEPQHTFSSTEAVDKITMTTKNAREDTQLKATFDIPRSASGTTTMIPYSLQMSDTHSNTSDIDRQLLAVDDDLIYDEDDITSLPMATKEGRTWQYKRSKDTCAPLASLESMGMCLLETDRITFDVTRNYASPTENVSPQSAPEDEMGSPSRIESFDSLSDLAGNSNTFSRNGSSNSIGPSTATAANSSTHQEIPLSTSLPHQQSQHTHHHTSHTAGLHRSPTHHHQHPHHQVCGSIDSGYSNDNSIDITSLTDSSHTGMNDSIYTGPRFSIGLI